MLSEAREKWSEIIYEYESDLNGIVFLIKKKLLYSFKKNKQGITYAFAEIQCVIFVLEIIHFSTL